MRKILAFLLACIITLGFAAPATTLRASQPDWETAMNRSLDRIRSVVSPNPAVGSVGGEWAVLALARADRVTADDPWVRAWIADLERTLAEVDRLSAVNDIQNPPSAGTFPSTLRRWTDFQRVATALSALGLSASDFNGRDLTAIFREYIPSAQRHAMNRTINADIFALIALNTMPDDADRGRFTASLLDAQRADGTWSLSPSAPVSAADIDITAMAIQALAPDFIRGDARVTASVNNALGWLRSQTFSDVEGTAQMIIALTALGRDFADEAEYFVSHLLNWFDTVSGGFRRPTPSDPVSLMATEQAASALVAYWRFVSGMNPFYDMRDAFNRVGEGTLPTPSPEAFGLPGRHPDISQAEVTSPSRTFGDTRNHPDRAAIEALAARGIIGGRSETVFDPNATMTRAEFAAVITRGLRLPPRPDAGFNDVPSGAWFAGAVGTAFYYEIISGTTAVTFNPNGTITRQEAAVMVTRAARLAGMDTELGDVETLNRLAIFGDYRTAARWAWSALAFCYREGILDDYEFYIEPLAAVTRGEIAGMLYRMLVRARLIV